MICRTSYDFSYYLDASGPKGLLGQLDANHLPSWLAPLDSKVPASKHVAVYRVLQDRLPQ